MLWFTPGGQTTRTWPTRAERHCGFVFLLFGNSKHNSQCFWRVWRVISHWYSTNILSLPEQQYTFLLSADTCSRGDGQPICALCADIRFVLLTCIYFYLIVMEWYQQMLSHFPGNLSLTFLSLIWVMFERVWKLKVFAVNGFLFAFVYMLKHACPLLILHI